MESLKQIVCYYVTVTVNRMLIKRKEIEYVEAWTVENLFVLVRLELDIVTGEGEGEPSASNLSSTIPITKYPNRVAMPSIIFNL